MHNTPMEKIVDFYVRRTTVHIAMLNYFASLIGHAFPNHDNDKTREPCRTGYAYRVWHRYNPSAVILPAQTELFWDAHATHHRGAAHHIEHYESVQDMPKIVLTEMVCDWFSANYEDLFLTPDVAYKTVMDYYNAQMATQHNWTDAQRAHIVDTINTIAQRIDENAVREIWSQIVD